MAAKKELISPTAFLLEETIEVPYQVVGTESWLEQYIPDSVSSRRRIWSPEVRDEILEFLVTKNAYGVDTESCGPKPKDGLDPISETSQLVLFQIGTKQQVYLLEPKLVVHLKEELQDSRRTKVLQNAVHDFKFLLIKHGIHMNRMYCTMLGEQVLTCGLFGLQVNLATLARKYYPHRIISKAVREWFRRENFDKPFPEVVLYYAARDVFLLVDIYLAQLQLLQEYHLLDVAKDEMRCIPCTAEMELTGIWLDQAKLKQTIQYNARQEREMAEQILALLPKKQSPLFGEIESTINLQSNSEKLEALRALGLDIDDVRRSTLEEIDLEVCQMLAQYTKLTKILTTYGQNLIDRVNPKDGRLRPRFSQLGLGEYADSAAKDTGATIATGRYSSDFQQLPRPANIFDPVTGSAELDLRQVFRKEIMTLKETVQEKAE